MKKLYRKGTVHPSPSPSPSLPVSEELSLSYLPAAILTLAAALSTEDKQVLAYLLSCSAASTTATASSDFSDDHHHLEASPKCYCFSCYSSFWARWDSSPNHQLIHDIIDALEDESFSQGKKKQSVSKRDRKKNNKGLEINANDRIVRNNDGSNGSGRVIPESGQNGDPKEVDGGQFEETGDKQGSVRKIVSFIGQRLWGTVWG